MKAASQTATPIFYPSLAAAALLPMLVLDQVRLVGSLSASLDATVSGVLATAGAVGAVLIMLAVCERVVRRAGERWLAAAALNFGLVELLRAVGVATSLFTVWRNAGTGPEVLAGVAFGIVTGVGLALLAAFLIKRFMFVEPKGKRKKTR